MKNGDSTASGFAPLSHPVIAKLAPLGRVHRFAPHTIVVIEGDFSDSSYLILQGRVKTFVSDSEEGSGGLDRLSRPLTSAMSSVPGLCCYLTCTVTRRKVAGMEVAPAVWLLFWLLNNASSSCRSSSLFPFFSAASNAFIVGP